MRLDVSTEESPRRVLLVCPELEFQPRGGASVYIVGIAQALRRTGAEVHVLATCTSVSAADWCSGAVLVPPRRRSVLAAAIALRPAMTSRFDIPLLRQQLRRLVEQDWDLVCVHHLSGVWATRILEAAHRRGRVKVWMYCAHNDEVSVRRDGLRYARLPDWPGRAVDLGQVWQAQRSLLRTPSSITAITPTDAASLGRRSGRRVVVVPPGSIATRRNAARGTAAPRAIVIAGSLRWRSKADNLRDLLAACADALELAGIQVLVAGKADPSFQRELQERFPAVRYLGEVASLGTVYSQARLAVIHEPRGGGFKMKVLDYATGGIPIVATAGSLIGQELEPSSFKLVDKLAALPAAVADLIDNDADLRRLAIAARDEVARRYSWDVSAATVLRVPYGEGSTSAANRTEGTV